MNDVPTVRKPTVTVAIPVFNGAAYVGEAIESVLRQTVAPTEVLVLDNCSTDHTREIAMESLGAAHVIERADNQGAIANFNQAVLESSSTFFAWLAADDRLKPRFVEAAADALTQHPEAALCLPAIEFIDSAGRIIGLQHDPRLGSTVVRTRLRAFLRRSHWSEVYSLYRRECLLASPMFRDAYGSDVLLSWWFLLRGPLHVLPEPLVQYRRYSTKSADATAESLNPNSSRRRWLMTSLWRALWRDTSDSAVDTWTRWSARVELCACLLHRSWLKHLAWDVYLVLGDVSPHLRRRVGVIMTAARRWLR